MAAGVAGQGEKTRLDEDDVALITAVANGDRRGLEQLYERYAAILLGVALSVLRGSRQEAEDLLHDVLLEVWQHAGDYDRNRGTVRTWMTLRMRSRAFDRLKSASRSRTVSLEDAPGAEERARRNEGGATPEMAPDFAKVRSALSELPVEQRQVIELQYFEGLSCSEAAVRLELPIGTVKSRVAAALRKLGNALVAGGAERPEKVQRFDS